jgi:hypothetical protein
MNVLTDYNILPDQIVAGQLPLVQNKPGQSDSPKLIVYGGDITLDGVTVSVEDHNLALPRSGERFLLFLKPFGDKAGMYELVRGAAFEVQPNGRMRGLLKSADSPNPYKDVTDASVSAIVAEIARGRR